jgi:hypothetical protein
MRSNLLMLAAATVLGAGGAMSRLGDPAQQAKFHPAAVRDTNGVEVTQTPAQMALTTSRAVLGAVGIENGARVAEVQTALTALSSAVREQSDPNALKMAFKAYFNYKAEHPENVRKPYLYFVDYGLSATKPRGYVFDMQALKVVDGPFTVAHGRGSSASGAGVPTRFSNREGSAATSLGLFLTQETYAFTGHTGGQAYHSVGLRLQGLSGSFNDAARQRRVVVHGAPYVTPSKAGRSEGCPAMEPARARKLLPEIGNGGLVFLFSPLDKTWMANDPWANQEPGLTQQVG